MLFQTASLVPLVLLGSSSFASAVSLFYSPEAGRNVEKQSSELDTVESGAGSRSSLFYNPGQAARLNSPSKRNGESSLFYRPRLAASAAACEGRSFAASAPLHNISSLPNPFSFYPYGNDTVKTKQDWACRQQQISDLFQQYELGVKPGKPASVSATFASNALSITVTQGGKSITFKPTITYPTTGQAPYPAVIGIGGVSIPKPSGVATINFNNNEMGAQTDQSSRSKGLFFDLYGSNATAGAMIAWAWGVSRIIDALEMTPSANIDPKRLAVTGCSRNGKGAYIAGAFDDRIALTLPQESGSGGSSCWRISDYMFAANQSTQTAHQIVRENVWFSSVFTPYASTNVLPLPLDHHMLPAIVAPRGLFVIENSDYLWLGPESNYKCMQAGHSIYEALGVSDNFGYSQIGGHGHCSFPTAKQGTQLDAFFQKFFFGKNTTTAIFETDQGFTPGNQTWVDWKYPNLVKEDGSSLPVSTALPAARTTATATATSRPTTVPVPAGGAPGGGASPGSDSGDDDDN